MTEANLPEFEDEFYLDPEDITNEYDIGEAPESDDEMDEEENITLSIPNKEYNYHNEPIYSFAINPSNPAIGISGSGDEVAVIWDLETGQAGHILEGHTDTIGSVGFNFDGTLAATGGYDGLVKIWNVENGNLLRTLDGPSEEIEWLQWHKKGNVIVAGSADGTIWLWLASTGDCMHVFAGHESNVTCGSFTGSGKMIVSGSEDQTIRIWNPKTGECAYVFRGHEGHEGPICTIECHPSQPIFVSGSQDGTLRLIHAQSKKVLAKLVHGTQESTYGTVGAEIEETVHSVESASFCKEFNWLASATLGGELRIWDLSNNQCRHVCNHSTGITKLIWHPTKPILATATVDGKVYVWDARSGACLVELQCHLEMILDLKIVPNGEHYYIYTASDDFTMRRFLIE